VALVVVLVVVVVVVVVEVVLVVLVVIVVVVILAVPRVRVNPIRSVGRSAGARLMNILYNSVKLDRPEHQSGHPYSDG